MATDNATIIGKFRLSGTNDFQQRIPDPSQAGMAATAAALFDPLNRDIWNKLYPWIINQIGTIYVNNQEWDNGLEQYVKDLPYGNSVEEARVGWVKAHTFMDPEDSLLRSHYSTGGVAFHSVNYLQYYPVSVNESQLRAAVQSEYGINELIAAIMTAPNNSDKYDVYRAMMQLFAVYDKEHPIYTIKLDSEPDGEAAFRSLLKSFIAWGQRLRFPSATYNATGDGDIDAIPVFANPEDLTLFVTPEIYAGIGVDGLALLYNDEYGKVPYKTTVVDEFPIAGVSAVLTTPDFFQCYRRLRVVEDFRNARKLETTYYLHDQLALSTSPFAPIICWGTRDGSSVSIVTQSVTGVDIQGMSNADQGDTDTQISIGGIKQLTVNLTGTISPETPGVDVKPDAVVWSVSAETAATEGNPIALNSRTYVDTDNVLHVQRTDLEAGNVLHVTGTAVYINPSGSTSAYTKTLDLTVKDYG